MTVMNHACGFMHEGLNGYHLKTQIFLTGQWTRNQDLSKFK